jgi:hypothetical protein
LRIAWLGMARHGQPSGIFSMPRPAARAPSSPTGDRIRRGLPMDRSSCTPGTIPTARLTPLVDALGWKRKGPDDGSVIATS